MEVGEYLGLEDDENTVYENSWDKAILRWQFKMWSVSIGKEERLKTDEISTQFKKVKTQLNTSVHRRREKIKMKAEGLKKMQSQEHHPKRGFFEKTHRIGKALLRLMQKLREGTSKIKNKGWL